MSLCCFQCFKQLMLRSIRAMLFRFFLFVMLIFVDIVFIFRSCLTRNSFDSIVGWCHFWILNEFSLPLSHSAQKTVFLQNNFTKFYISLSVIKMKIHANDQTLKNIIWSVSVAVLNARRRNRKKRWPMNNSVDLGRASHFIWTNNLFCRFYFIVCLPFVRFEWMQSAPRISNFRIAGVTLTASKWEINVFTCFKFVSTFRLFGWIRSESWITHITYILNVKEI